MYFKSHSSHSAKKRVFPDISLNRKIEYMGKEKVDEKGRVSVVGVWKTDDPVHRYDGLHFEDFYLENLIDAGVDLKFSQLNMNNFETCEQFEK